MSTWSTDTGTYILCIAAIVGLVAAYLARAWDKWEEQRAQRLTHWEPTQEQIERSKR